MNRASELETLRFWTSSKALAYDISITNDPYSLTFKATEPDHEETRSFLLLFRHFVSDSEPVQFNRIANDCRRHLRSDEGKDVIAFLRKRWRDVIERPFIQYEDRTQKSLTNGDLLDLWINGHYFHSNPDKRQQLDDISGDELPIARMRLNLMLAELSRLVLALAATIRHGIKVGGFDSIANPESSK